MVANHFLSQHGEFYLLWLGLSVHGVTNADHSPLVRLSFHWTADHGLYRNVHILGAVEHIHTISVPLNRQHWHYVCFYTCLVHLLLYYILVCFVTLDDIADNFEIIKYLE